MRSIIAGGLVGLGLLVGAVAVGCDSPPDVNDRDDVFVQAVRSATTSDLADDELVLAGRAACVALDVGAPPDIDPAVLPIAAQAYCPDHLEEFPWLTSSTP